MIKYIGKRILMLVPVLLGVVLLVFSMMYFSPGNAEDYILGDMATEEDKEAFREENGLNKPFFIQYINYVKDALQGDLGISYTTKQPVSTEIFKRFPITFKLALLSTLWSIVIGITIGIISAVKQYSIMDHVTRLIAMLGVSVPTFWEGLMLIILFSVQLALLPASGFTTWKHWILPSFTIGIPFSSHCNAYDALQHAGSDSSGLYYNGKTKGQTNFVVITKHALRNAIIPVMTLVGVNFGRLLGGSAITEIVFSIPGLGNLIIDGIKVKNAPLVQGGILVIALAMALCNLIVDVLYAYVDPRIRSQYVKPKVKMAAAKSAATEEK